MLTLNNISKAYVTKKKIVTKAINNLSLEFDSTGMCFILGKSGCGKSTLLNLIGGLDKYDNGEITILGKSSHDFSQQDFDSYRNTYVGFVFQEYNLLEEYNVYENIVLALQLQQKVIDETKVDDLLTNLNILNLKNRKINELSGGQKQRVAVARALIKEPKIILADEPTGNLDSNTANQIMELLKKISEDHLVIIVSHDKQAANIYADRIIELSDGEIISDQVLSQTNDVKESKYQVVKSKLPLITSVKLGLTALKHKKIKLVVTIFLACCALLSLGIADTFASYNINKSHAKLLVENDENSLQIQHYLKRSEDEHFYYDGDYSLQLLTTKQINEIANNLDMPVYKVFRFAGGSSLFANINESLNIQMNNQTNSYYINDAFAEVVELDDFTVIKQNIIGEIPERINEIVISNYVADLIIANGIEETNSSNIFRPSNYQELLDSAKLIN